MRNDRGYRYLRRSATPEEHPVNTPLRNRERLRRLWPLRAVLRRVERRVEAEDGQEPDSAYAAAFGGDDPNA